MFGMVIADIFNTEVVYDEGEGYWSDLMASKRWSTFYRGVSVLC